MRVNSTVWTLSMVPMLLGGLWSDATAQTTPAAGQPPATAQPQRGRRQSPPQPQQQQGPEYFAGAWGMEWLGRESPITSGPRTGTVTFARQGATNVLGVTAEGETDAGAAYKETGTFEWDPASKTMSIRERTSAGVEVVGTGNWGSPLSMLYESQPVQTKGGTLRLRRTYRILSAQAFQIIEEMSTSGGPWQRLGSGDYTRK